MPSMPTMPKMDTLPDELAKKWAAIKPYTLDVQQGVVIDEDMIGRLKTGMTRTQVGYVLGTPLLADPFHASRWDYVFYTRKKGQLSPVRNLTVFFKEDKLERFVTDYPLPKPAEPTKAAEAQPAPAKATDAKPAEPPAPPPDVLPNATRPVTGGGR